MADDGHTSFPGGGKIAGLALLLVAVVALIVKGPWAGPAPADAPDLALLQDLGTGAAAPLDDLERRLGGPAGDDPVDLLDLPAGGPPARPAATSAPAGGMDIPGDEPGPGGLDLPGDRPVASPTPVASATPGGLDIPDEPASPIPVPTRAPTASPVATRAPTTPPASQALRPVDAGKLFAAYQAGDHAYLESVMRDSALETAGRALGLVLAALLPDAPVDHSFYEIFEGTREPFELRETSAYALLQRKKAEFPGYLVRVLGRPAVRAGEDRQTARLVLLSFAADRWLQDGQALDQVGTELMREARAGSPVAAAALSFALAPGQPLAEDRDRLEALAGEQPVISENLRRFYEAMVERGQAQYRPALERLQTAGL